MRTRRMLLQVAFVALLALIPAIEVKADPILTLTAPNGFGVGGEFVDFFGEITNGGTDPIIVQDILTSLGRPEFFFVDITPFFNNPGYGAEGFQLTAGQSTGNILLFSVFIDPSTPGGTSAFGFVSVFDANGVESNVVRFSITAVPEPATLVLLGTGLAGIAAARRRKRREAIFPEGT